MLESIYKVQTADYEDIKVMITLLKELPHFETDYVFSERKHRAGLRRLLNKPDSTVLVAKQDDLIVGMCTVQIIISTAEGGLIGLLENIVVHYKFRRQGIGRILLTAAEKWATEQKLIRMQLLADAANETALKFLESQGWHTSSLICQDKAISLQRKNLTTAPPSGP